MARPDPNAKPVSCKYGAPMGRQKLSPVREVSAAAVIIRCTTMRGPDQAEALAELDRRGLWLSDYQRRQAGLEAFTGKETS